MLSLETWLTIPENDAEPTVPATAGTKANVASATDRKIRARVLMLPPYPRVAGF
jgi:hypothetical protein